MTGTVGEAQITTLFEQLNDAMSKKQTEHAVYIKNEIHLLIKQIFKQNNSLLWACVVKNFSSMFEQNSNIPIDKLAILFKFDAEEIDLLNYCILKKDFGLIRLACLHPPILQEISEELERSRTTVKSFIINAKNILIEKMHLNITIKDVDESFEQFNIAVKNGDVLKAKYHFGIIKANLNNQMYENNPEQYANILQKLFKVLSSNIQEEKAFNSLLITLLQIKGTLLNFVTKLFKSDNQHMWLLILLDMSLLGDYARKYGLSSLELANFKQAVKKCLLDKNEAKVPEIDPKHLIILQLFKFIDSCMYLDREIAIKELISTIKMIKVNPDNYFYPLGFTEIDSRVRMLFNLNKYGTELDLAKAVIDDCDLLEYLQLEGLYSAEDVIKFRQNIKDDITSYFNCSVKLDEKLEFLRSEILNWQETESQSISKLKVLKFRVYQVLLDAHLKRDVEDFRKIVEFCKNIVKEMNQKGQRNIILRFLSEFTAAQHNKVFLALDKDDDKELSKSFVDMILKRLYAEEKKMHPDVDDLFESVSVRIKAKIDFDNAISKFQRELYNTIGMSADVSLVQITEDFKNSLPYSEAIQKTSSKLELSEIQEKSNNPELFKDYCICMFVYLKNQFQENNKNKFFEALLSIDEFMQKIYTREPNKIAWILSIIGVGTDFEYKYIKYINVNIRTYFYLLQSTEDDNELKINRIKLLLNIINFSDMSQFDSKYYERIREFKKWLLNKHGYKIEQEFKQLQKHLECLVGTQESYRLSCVDIEYHKCMAMLSYQQLFANTCDAIGCGRLGRAITLIAAKYSVIEISDIKESYINENFVMVNDMFDGQFVTSVFTSQNDLLWCLINNKDFTYFAKQNGIHNGNKLTELKQSLNLSNPLLPSVDQIIKQVNSEFGGQKSFSDLSEFAVFRVNTKGRDYFLRIIPDDFVEDLKLTVVFLKEFVQNNQIAIISRITNLDSNDLRLLVILLKNDNVELTCLYLLQQMQISSLAHNNLQNHEDIQKFFKAVRSVLETESNKIVFSKNDMLLKDTNSTLIPGLQEGKLIPQQEAIQIEWSIRFFQYYTEQDAEAFGELLKLELEYVVNAFRKNMGLAIIQALKLNNLQTEQLFKALEANDNDEILRTLKNIKFDAFNKHHGLFLYTFNNNEFSKKIFEKLEISEIDITNPYKLVTTVATESGVIVEFAKRLKEQSNKGANLQVYNRTITVGAKLQELHDALIVPSKDDSSHYHDLYKNMQRIWLDHLLAHRFGVDGDVELSGLHYKLSGSYSQTMVKEAQVSFERFSKSPKYHQILDTIKTELFGEFVEEEAWKQLILNLPKDVENISAKWDADNFTKQYNGSNPISIPINLIIGDEGHANGAIIFCVNSKHYCMMVDRGGDVSDEQCGLSIYEVKNSENINSFAKTLIESNSCNINLNILKQQQESLGSVHLHTIKKKLQKSGNCGFSSCAKLLIQGSQFARVFMYAINAGKTQEDAVLLAAKSSNLIAKEFSSDDRREMMHRYIIECNDNKIEHNKILLSKIYLKCKNKSKYASVMELFSDFAINFTEEDLVVGRKSLIDDIKQLLISVGFLSISEEKLNEISEEIYTSYFSGTLYGQDSKSLKGKILELKKLLTEGPSNEVLFGFSSSSNGTVEEEQQPTSTSGIVNSKLRLTIN
ncbi:MAG: hypothetical protein ABSA84_03110 [Gammaproteobacteria bacterium]|jgi:hypothetical protein